MEKLTLNNPLKKALILLEVLILTYHNLDDEENKILSENAVLLDAQEELEWAKEFIYEDFPTSIKRSREYLFENLQDASDDEKFYVLKEVWATAEKKGFVTELEAMTMLKIASDWGLVNKLLALARSK